MSRLKQFLGLTYYTSAIDNFIYNFRKKHQKLSHSQQKEVNKYNRIFALRDKPMTLDKPINDHLKHWDHF